MKEIKKTKTEREVDPNVKEIVIWTDRKDAFNEWFSMDPTAARIHYYGQTGPIRHFSETKFYKDSEKMCVSSRHSSIRMNCSGALYLTHKCAWGFTYDFKTKKVKKWFGNNILLNKDVIKCINENFIDLEWLQDINAFIPDLASSAPLLGHVLSGKITNGRDLIKQYLKTHARGIKISSEIVYKYIKANPAMGSMKWYTSRARYCKNPDVLFSDGFFGYDDFEDTMQQARQLNRKIDLKWSENKLSEVHKLWTREIMAIHFKGMPDFAVEYEGKLPELKGFKLIGDQKELFAIGSIEDHCVYTNYWEMVERKKYFVLYGQYQGKYYTCGISRNAKYRPSATATGEPMVYADGKTYDNVFSVSQIQSKRNKGCPPELNDIVDKWVADSFVQDFFHTNYDKPKGYALRIPTPEANYLEALPF